MAEAVSVNEAFVDVRQEGDRWRGYITPAWFRYLIASTPEGTGTGTGVLHGNGGGGAPTWGPVVLTTDVSGVLPAANGGLGGVTGIVGGVLYATGVTAYAFTAAGTAHQVLHGGATPTWGAVDISADTSGSLDLATRTTGSLDVATRASGILPIVHGGTGTNSATGNGDVVLKNFPDILNQTATNLTVHGSFNPTVAMDMQPDVLGAGIGWQNGSIISHDTRVIAINNAGPTTFLGLAWGTFFILLDKTSGGMAFGVMDAVGGINVVVNTMVGVSITQNAGTKLLQGQVTAGASPRNISVMGLVLQT